MTWFSGIDKFANSINPMKQPMQWLTDNTIGKIPGQVGKVGAHTYDYSNSHPVESLGAMLAAYYGASALGGMGEGGGAAGAGAGGAAEGGGAGLGGLGTSSGFGGVGMDAGATGFGGAGGGLGAGSLGTSSGFGGVGMDAGATGFDGASVDPALAGDNIDAGGGWNPASGGSSGLNWQGMAKQFMSNGLKQQGQQSANRQGYQPSMYGNQNSNGYVGPSYQSANQRIAQALMIPNMNAEGATVSPTNSALLAQQLLRQG